MAEDILRLGMTLRQVALAMRRAGRLASFAQKDIRPISMTAWLMLAVAVKKLEREAFNEGIERAAKLSDEWGGVPGKIRKLSR